VILKKSAHGEKISQYGVMYCEAVSLRVLMLDGTDEVYRRCSGEGAACVVL